MVMVRVMVPCLDGKELKRTAISSDMLEKSLNDGEIEPLNCTKK